MNIVFDFGGVLFDWQPARLMRELLPNRARDHAAAERLVRDFFQGYGGDWAAFDRGTTTQEALAQRIGSRLGWPLDEVNAVISAVPAALTPRPAMVALLDALHHRGWPLYFLSNMPASYADHLDRTHDFLGRFRGGVYSSRSGLIKPEPEIYALTSRRFALELHRIA